MYFDDFYEGYTVNVPPIEIKKNEMMSYALLYDRSDLHINEEYAKTTMFKDLIASGFYTAGLIYGAFTGMNIYEGSHIAGDKTYFEWPAPVYAGDTIRGVVTLKEVTKLSERRGKVVEVMEIFNQNDKLVCRGTITKYLLTKKGAGIE